VPEGIDDDEEGVAPGPGVEVAQQADVIAGWVLTCRSQGEREHRASV
jgi:hypothetical protein